MLQRLRCCYTDRTIEQEQPVLCRAVIVLHHGFCLLCRCAASSLEVFCFIRSVEVVVFLLPKVLLDRTPVAGLKAAYVW
jgi:hypothetical protein